MADVVARAYPKVSGWIADGWIELGQDGFSRSFVRVLDQGGLIWEGGQAGDSVDDLLQAAEAAIERWERGELP